MSATDPVLSGAAWRKFCADLADVGDMILDPGNPSSPIDRAEGYRYLTRLLRMGLEQQIEALPLVVSRQPQYLGLARKPGREVLAQAFAEELRRFKQEPAYAAIMDHYTHDPENLANAVEQQESSTAR